MRLSKAEQRRAEDLGGAEDPNIYKKKNKRYCDKGGHRERAIANHEKDRKHWRR